MSPALPNAPASPAMPSHPPAPRAARLAVGWILLGAALAAAAASPDPVPRVIRSLPRHFSPSTPLPLTLSLVPDPAHAAVAVEESIPSGWNVSSISHGGAFDPIRRQLKWGPFTDSPALARTLTATLTPPAAAAGFHAFSGRGHFDTVQVVTSGDSGLSRFPGALTRFLPPHYLPDQPVPVTLEALPAPDAHAYAVEEQPPPGWHVSAISHNGEWDPVTGRIKWGPFTESPFPPRTFTYTATPPDDASGPAAFAGRALFNAVEVPAAGSLPLPPHPNRIDPAGPPTYLPGQPWPLALHVVPSPATRAWTVEQRVPPGWEVGTPSHDGVFDPVTRRIKWGPFTESPAVSRALACSLTPPPDADGIADLGGLALFDRESVPYPAQPRRFRLRETSTVTRSLPPLHEALVPITVTLAVVARDDTRALAVEDRLPPGWTVAPGGVDDGGAFDPRHGSVKWGPIFSPDTEPRVLTYRATPPPDALGAATFDGIAMVGPAVLPIEGDSTTVAPAGRITRLAPPRYSPEVPFEIRIDTLPGPRTEAHATEDAVPEGWSFHSATEGGHFDPLNRRVKWGPFSDPGLRSLTYRIVPPSTPEPSVAFHGQGAFDRTLVPISGADSASLNSPPIAIPDSAGRNPGELFKISAIKLTLNDSDPDGDFPTVVSVESPSDNGALVVLDWPWIYYIPDPDDNRQDRFRYTIDDGFGATASAMVNVVINPPPASAQNIIRIETLPDGSRRILFAGVPGYTYRIEASGNLTLWTPLASRTAPANGLFDYLDPDAPLFPIRYYRSVWP